MTREQWKERLPLIQAYVDGEVIENKFDGEWHAIDSPAFIEPVHRYRIKPEPSEGAAALRVEE
ncbi:MAG: hypothetical protein ACKO0Z_08620 [Betaproteobacteria bacterium]